MDPQEYRDARWYALLRAATDLGVDPEEAPALVQRLLDEQRRAIRRADDPDPLVHAALRDAVLGPPLSGHRPRWPGVAALAAALAVVGVVVALTRPEEPLPDRLRGDQVPSLFGYDGADARSALEARGFRVTLQPTRDCEVYGRVVASDPPPGTAYDRGDRITVYTSIPADVVCLNDYQDRATAWQLLDFANGRGPAPEFADRVFVYAGGAAPVVLDGTAARDPDAWAGTGVLEGLRAASDQVGLVDEHPLTYAIPAIRITRTDEGIGACGVPEPSVAGTGDAFAVLVRSPDRTGCPVRLDVFRDGDAILAVAYYPAS
ncbi:PASTA domain-containing protein [Nocardioides aquiterrae]|uniref:PASTA domain-containing protein n=1 Tax=Nocardioides aquiterrae TaxID=203799 RepID=A0ABN1U7K4_9ACTN